MTQNCIHKEIKRRLKLGDACYHAVQNPASSCLLSKNIRIKRYKIIILPVVLCDCEAWSLTIRKQHTFKVFENRVPRKISGATRDEVTGGWKKLHNEGAASFLLFTKYY
jgi:hypothetical protein